MSAREVAQVRRFNRAVTQRVGALNEDYLARGRPLAEARILWEIGAEGCEVRALRSRLGLDSGHASRLLRSLERDGLIERTPDPRDRRRSLITLTARARELEDSLISAAREVNAIATEGLQEHEKTTFMTTLTKVIENLESSDRPVSP